MNRRIRVAWVCHFVNQYFNNYFGKWLHERAPWIDQLIKLFEDDDHIELHIIAPNPYFKRDYCHYLNGIYYHFFMEGVPLIHRKIDNFFRIHSRIGYCFNRRRVERLIEEIRPDIIHLHGAENAYYSSTIFSIMELYPTIVTIQGFISDSLPQTGRGEKKRRYQIRTEQEILRRAKYFGVYSGYMEAFIRRFNAAPVFFWHDYPFNNPKLTKNYSEVDSKYDCVFFARLCPDKGIEDLIKAISVIKKERKDVSLIAMGSASGAYMHYLKQLCRSLDVTENIKFLGFVKTQQQVFQEAIKAKVCVLPTYHDLIPGTIIESMYMRIPVVSYAVGGNLDLNRDGEVLLLSEKGRVDELAKNMLRLISNRELRIQLSEKAYEYVKERFDNRRVVEELLATYKALVDGHK